MWTSQGLLSAETRRSAVGRAYGQRLRRRGRRSFSADDAVSGENGDTGANASRFGASEHFRFYLETPRLWAKSKRARRNFA